MTYLFSYPPSFSLSSPSFTRTQFAFIHLEIHSWPSLGLISSSARIGYFMSYSRNYLFSKVALHCCSASFLSLLILPLTVCPVLCSPSCCLTLHCFLTLETWALPFVSYIPTGKVFTCLHFICKAEYQNRSLSNLLWGITEIQ